VSSSEGLVRQDWSGQRASAASGLPVRPPPSVNVAGPFGPWAPEGAREEAFELL